MPPNHHCLPVRQRPCHPPTIHDANVASFNTPGSSQPDHHIRPHSARDVEHLMHAHYKQPSFHDAKVDPSGTIQPDPSIRSPSASDYTIRPHVASNLDDPAPDPIQTPAHSSQRRAAYLTTDNKDRGRHKGNGILRDMLSHYVVSSRAPMDSIRSIHITLKGFCSLLLSAHFDSAYVLSDILSHVQLNAYIKDKYLRISRNPSDQRDAPTCYAHAIATAVHMALLRVIGREEGYPIKRIIRQRILDTFSRNSIDRFTPTILKQIELWYRPLHFKVVDEEGARRAVSQGRPVLTTFRLSESGWENFSTHFQDSATRKSVLTRAQMQPYRSSPEAGGHAVVLTACNSESLTFLNSWGSQWGDNGSFSVEDHTVLETDSDKETDRTAFYDIVWFEGDLTAAERQAYTSQVEEALIIGPMDKASIFGLDISCPICRKAAPLANFTGSIAEASCPHCHIAFPLRPEDLVQSLHSHLDSTISKLWMEEVKKIDNLHQGRRAEDSLI